MRALVLLALLLFAGSSVGFILTQGEAQPAGSGPPTSGPMAAPSGPGEDRSADGPLAALRRWLPSGGAGGEAPAPRNDPGDGAVYYQWVDDDGAVHFVSTLEEVPAKWRDAVGRIELDERPRNVVSTPPRAARRAPAAEPQARNVARVSADVVVYTAPWCGWCRKTIAWLDQRGIRYENRDIESDSRYRDELVEKTGRTSIPVVEIDGELVRGYDPNRMSSLLGT